MAVDKQNRRDMDAGREPCPYRIVSDAGGAFALGAAGGTVWHSVRGWRNSPRGERLLGMRTAVKARAPVLGGNFAVWGLMFSSFDCTFAWLRRKEDPWNSIMAGAATGGLLVARAGRRAMVQHAIGGGVMLALIEGLNILITQRLAPPPEPGPGQEIPQMAAPPQVTAILSGTGGDTSGLLDASSVSVDVGKASANVFSDNIGFKQ